MLRASLFSLLIEKIMPHKLVQQFIPVNFADQTARIVVIGDIGRIFRKKVAYDLVDGIIAFFTEGTINGHKCIFHFQVGVVCKREFDGIAGVTVHSGMPPFNNCIYHIAFSPGSKAESWRILLQESYRKAAFAYRFA